MSHFILQFNQILILAITFKDVRNFILGMLTGFVLLALFVGILLVTERNTKSKIKMSKMSKLNDTKIQEMIEAKQKQMIETVKMTDNAYFNVAFDLSVELMNEIAHYYFPESKYPMYELSIQEILDLSKYITDRLQTLINGRVIRRFKNYRVSTIINLLNKKKAIDNSKLMKLSRKMQVNKILSVGKTVLNYANPIFWFRKFAIKPSTTLLTKEACRFIIQIFGEETNTIYSKKLYETPDDESKLENDYDHIVDETLESNIPLIEGGEKNEAKDKS